VGSRFIIGRDVISFCEEISYHPIGLFNKTFFKVFSGDSVLGPKNYETISVFVPSRADPIFKIRPLFSEWEKIGGEMEERNDPRN
jgi:hypothetical protein